MKMQESKNFQNLPIPSLGTRFIKRTFDICSSGLFLLVLSPFFLLFTPIVALCMQGNPLFVQKRPGKDGKIFSLLKYRTMTNARDRNGHLLPDEKRITKFGTFLRSTSIDELPELLLIFCGKMSVVGPRPQLIQDMVFMTEEQKMRHIVRPGLTGLAQINGRNNISWEQKLEYDLAYIRNGISLPKDLRIIGKTISKVLSRKDIAREGTVSDTSYGQWLLQEGKISEEEYNRRLRLAEKTEDKARKKKNLPTKIKCYFRKLFSARIIPYIVINPLRIILYRLCGYSIGKNVFIGMRCYLDDLEPKMLTIEDDVIISYGVFFSCHGYGQSHTPIIVRKGAYIGMRATLLSGKNGIQIGEKSVIGACTLVNKDIPPSVTAVGVPCKIIKNNGEKPNE